MIRVLFIFLLLAGNFALNLEDAVKSLRVSVHNIFNVYEAAANVHSVGQDHVQFAAAQQNLFDAAERLRPMGNAFNTGSIVADLNSGKTPPIFAEYKKQLGWTNNAPITGYVIK